MCNFAASLGYAGTLSKALWVFLLRQFHCRAFGQHVDFVFLCHDSG